jgi:lipopolysaccharide export system protein LptA
LSGPQGDIKAERIVIFLAKDENRLERLEAATEITLRVDQRVATGNRLAYYASGERYFLTGLPAAPVTVVEACRQTTGSTLTFFRSTDRIIVDGNEEIRTRTTSGGPCPQPPLQ